MEEENNLWEKYIDLPDDRAVLVQEDKNMYKLEYDCHPTELYILHRSGSIDPNTIEICSSKLFSKGCPINEKYYVKDIAVNGGTGAVGGDVYVIVDTLDE